MSSNLNENPLVLAKTVATVDYLNPDNGFLRWQREEREARGRGFDGIELIGG